MKKYARIQDGTVVEVIPPMADENENEIAIEKRFHPDFVAALAEIPEGVDVEDGWLFANGAFSQPPAPTEEEIEAVKVKAAENKILEHLDAAAKAKGYDNILSASSYAALPSGAPFQAEGHAFAVWRASCWAKAYEILADVKAGLRDEPTLEALIEELPVLVLP